MKDRIALLRSDDDRPRRTAPVAKTPRRTAASLRPLYRLRWVWLVPAVAAAIVLWLGFRAVAERGPLITITFENAEGVEAGRTKLMHRSVPVGVVETVTLKPDMSAAVIGARMNKEAVPYLTTGTRFWVVRPRVTPAGISGLTTILSGAYIEMDPESGKPTKEFTGLDQEPPILKPTAPGRSVTVVANQLGSIEKGSKVTYHGIPVGAVLGYRLAPDGRTIEVLVRVNAPYDALISEQTRFWNVGGMAVGSIWSGFRINSGGLQDLLSGGSLAFDTVRGQTLHKPGAPFLLYDNEKDARADKPPAVN
jgi:paraquat-inducible protein B